MQKAARLLSITASALCFVALATDGRETAEPLFENSKQGCTGTLKSRSVCCGETVPGIVLRVVALGGHVSLL